MSKAQSFQAEEFLKAIEQLLLYDWLQRSRRHRWGPEGIMLSAEQQQERLLGEDNAGEMSVREAAAVLSQN